MKAILYSVSLTVLLGGLHLMAGCTRDTEACITIYQPVCADNVTYGNECEARRAGKTQFTQGECGASVSPSPNP